MRSRTVTITPKRAAEMLEHNGHNRPLTRTRVREFAEAMKRGDWQLTHQGIAFDTDGQLKDGQHRLAAIVEADLPVTMLVSTDLAPETFDVLDTGKRRTAADALTINGEKSTSMLAAMVRVIWLAEHLPASPWTGTNATVTNHQVVATLDQHPRLREFVSVGERVANETGMIKSAAGAASYLVSAANPDTGLEDWFDGVIEGSGLAKDDPRLVFRKLMFAMTRQQAGQVQRRRDTREHVTLYLTAFNAWAGGHTLTRLRYTPRDPVPAPARKNA